MIDNNLDDYKGLFLYYVGYGYDRSHKYQKAIEIYKTIVNQYPDLIVNDKKHIGEVYSRLAVVNGNLGHYEESYEYQLKSLDAAEISKDTFRIGSSLYNLGSFFFYQKQYKEALAHYKQAKKCFDTTENTKKIYASLAAIGTTYESLDSLEKSLEYSKRSLNLAQKIGYNTGISYSLSNIGSTYLSLERYDEAFNFLSRAMQLKIAANDKWGQIGNLRSLSEIFIYKGKPERSLVYLEKALTLAKEIEAKPRQLEILERFSKAYKMMGKYKEALNALETHRTLKESLLNEQTVKQMGELKESFEVKQKENEIYRLEKENEVLEKDKKIDQLYNYIIGSVVLIFGVLLLLVISRYRAQKISSELLAEKSEEINRQNSELQKVNSLLSETNKLLEGNKLKIEQQNKALESSNEDLRNFASVASHDLKEPLRMIGSYTSILKKRYTDSLDERAQEFMGYVVDGVSRMEQLINNLLDYSRVSIDGGETSNYKYINLRDITEIVKRNLRYSIVQSSATINIENEENFPLIKANQTQMMQLMQNLVSNALKFKGAGLPIVTVGFETKEDFHTFYVRDNGIGISKENQEKIFEMLTRLHSKQEYEGTGIGLATVRKIVQRHQGRVWVESKAGEGSTFYFTMPVAQVEQSILVSQS